MSALIPGGSETKCQPSSPGYRHSGAVNSKIPMRATGRHYGVPPTAPSLGAPAGARAGAVHGVSTRGAITDPTPTPEDTVMAQVYLPRLEAAIAELRERP